MLKEKFKPSHNDVLPAITSFIGEAFFQEDIQDLPDDLKEIFTLFLETEQANSQIIRIKMLRCIKTVRKLKKALKPFTKEQVKLACNSYNSN